MPDSRSINARRGGRLTLAELAKRAKVFDHSQKYWKVITRPLQSLGAALMLGIAIPSSAQAGLLDRLLGERLGSVEEGSYVAGDDIRFDIRRDGRTFLLHFPGNTEVFVLSPDRTSFGAKVLRYDSGETAIRVSGWGGLTLYTDAQPNGLPAARIGDSPPIAPSPVSLQDVQFIAAQEAARLHRRHLRIAFTVDWSVLETSADLRATASEAMGNAALAIERFVRDRDARKILSKRIDKVTLATGLQPSLRIEQKTLIVTFNPEHGYAGCGSSRWVLGTLFSLLGTAKKQAVANALPGR